MRNVTIYYINNLYTFAFPLSKNLIILVKIFFIWYTYNNIVAKYMLL